MEIRDGEPYCPNCTDKLSMWNPSHNAMLKIAIEVGSMWFGTGCAGPSRPMPLPNDIDKLAP